MLKFVRDIMHTGATVPLCPPGTPMSDAIVVMTAKGFGCVGIADERAASSPASSPTATCAATCADLLDARVEDGDDAQSPRRCGRSACERSAGTANSSKITTVFVVDGGKPRGILHMHDLLRHGRGPSATQRIAQDIGRIGFSCGISAHHPEFLPKKGDLLALAGRERERHAERLQPGAISKLVSSPRLTSNATRNPASRRPSIDLSACVTLLAISYSTLSFRLHAHHLAVERDQQAVLDEENRLRQAGAGRRRRRRARRSIPRRRARADASTPECGTAPQALDGGSRPALRPGDRGGSILDHRAAEAAARRRLHAAARHARSTSASARRRDPSPPRW